MDDWVYYHSFIVPDNFTSRGYIEFVFEGLDTHADIKINGYLLGSTNNAHRTWILPIDKTKILIGQQNDIEITFKSAVKHDLALEEAFNKTYNMTLPANYSFSRKAAYHYGWDWGPRLVTAGIWKPIKLRAFNYVQFSDVYLRNEKVTADSVKKSVRIYGKVNLRVLKGPENGYQYRLIIADNNTGQVYYNQNFTANYTPIPGDHEKI